AVSSTVPPPATVERCPLDGAVRYTVAPAAPSSSAMPLPRPRLAPVTSAVRPASGRAAGGWRLSVRCARMGSLREEVAVADVDVLGVVFVGGVGGGGQGERG